MPRHEDLGKEEPLVGYLGGAAASIEHEPRERRKARRDSGHGKAWGVVAGRPFALPSMRKASTRLTLRQPGSKRQVVGDRVEVGAAPIQRRIPRIGARASDQDDEIGAVGVPHNLS